MVYSISMFSCLISTSISYAPQMLLSHPNLLSLPQHHDSSQLKIWKIPSAVLKCWKLTLQVIMKQFWETRLFWELCQHGLCVAVSGDELIDTGQFINFSATRIRQWSYQDIRLVTQQVVQNLTTWPCLPCFWHLCNVVQICN